MDTTSDDLLQPLIRRCYDAVLDTRLWSGLAHELARALDSTSAVLKMHRSDGSVALTDTTPNLDLAGTHQDLAEYWHRNDLWVERSLAHGPCQIVTSEQLVPPVEFERSGYYQDWLRPLEIYHLVGGVFPVGNATCVLGIHRPKRAGRYTPAEQRRAALLLPHLQQALRLHHALGQQRQAAQAGAEALGQQGRALLVVQAQGIVCYASPLAETWLQQQDVLRVHAGRLSAHPHALAQRLQTMLSQALATASDGAAWPAPKTLMLPRPKQLPLLAWVSPLLPGDTSLAALAPAALVLLRDPEWMPALDAQSLALVQESFALTPKEAQLAQALMAGTSLQQAAQALGISEGHARQRLQVLFSKTGTTRQAELLLLLGRFRLD